MDKLTSEDELAKQKEMINCLIPNLLNDEKEEPRTFNRDNIQDLFIILLENRSKSLCYYAQKNFVSYFLDDIFALECGVCGTIQQIQDRMHYNGISLEYFMKDFEFRFSLTEGQLSELKDIYNI